MPDLTFQIHGVEAAARGLVPLLEFGLAVRNTPVEEEIKGGMLHVQIQFECPRRSYSAEEKEKLVELFGRPEQWGQTLRNRLWTHATATLPTFTKETTVRLPVPCSFDLQLGAAKYLYGLSSGDVPLLFLFSGTVFYTTPDGRLQAQRISWERECAWRMPVQTWHELMEQHWPNTGWLTLRRDLLERLATVKRDRGLASWDETIEQLLADAECGREAEALLDFQP
jgi:hypothetical protein